MTTTAMAMTNPIDAKELIDPPKFTLARGLTDAKETGSPIMLYSPLFLLNSQ
jgi:hypothetical protein